MDQLLGLSEPWAYLLIGALAVAEASAFVGLFLPGEAAMLLGGVLAYQGRVSLGLMIMAGCVGSIVGDSIGYEIGRHLGPRLKSGRLGRRIGEERWERAARYLRERGGRAVFLGRFVGVLGALVPAVAGSAGMPYRAFLPANVAGGILWASAFILLGYVFGGSWKVVERWAGRASLVLLLLLGLGVAIALGTRWVRDHTGEISSRWRTLIDRPRVVRLRRRYQMQIDFLVRRIDWRSVMGLRLTAHVADTTRSNETVSADWVTDAAAGLALALSWFAISHSVANPASVRPGPDHGTQTPEIKGDPDRTEGR